VDWETSYSLYGDAMARQFDASVDRRWSSTRARLIDLLQRDAELREVASVVGPEALEDKDRLLLAAAAAMRELVLGQSAFDPNDAFSPPAKTFALADAALRAFDRGMQVLAGGAGFADVSFDGVRRALVALRDVPAPDMVSARRGVEDAITTMAVSASTADATRDRP
jgi:V/A-type H+-transporting ATPase subunit A